MKRHVKIYLESRGYWGEEYVVCEWCGSVGILLLHYSFILILLFALEVFMGNKIFINEEGKRYSKLVVDKIADKPIGKTGIWWLCKCDCGNTKIVSGRDLRHGCVKSCGCLDPYLSVDESGNRYKTWTVIGRNGSSATRHAQWLCKCDCGATRSFLGAVLRKGYAENCKCQDSIIAKRIKEKGFNSVVKMLYKSCYHGARRRDIVFDITIDHMAELIVKNCHYCGSSPRSIVLTATSKSRRYYNANGIDRVDSSIGYIPDNIVPCCKTCNIAKNSMSDNDFRDWINRCYNHLFINKNA